MSARYSQEQLKQQRDFALHCKKATTDVRFVAWQQIKSTVTVIFWVLLALGGAAVFVAAAYGSIFLGAQAWHDGMR